MGLLLRWINFFTGRVQDRRDVEANCLDLEMHNPFSTAKKTLDLVFYSSDSCQCQWRLLLLQCLMEMVLLVWKCFSLEAIKTGPRWGRRDWAAALVNSTGCPRIGTKGSLWVIFLAGCLEWVRAVFPHSTALTVQVPPPCVSQNSVVWHGCITWDFVLWAVVGQYCPLYG